MPLPRIELADAATFLASRAELTEAYQEAFSGPPWDESDGQALAFTAALPDWAARDGFAAAWAREGATVIGFAFRVRTPQPVPWEGFYGLLRDRFGAGVDDLAGAVEVVELAVRPGARGGGLGRALLDAIVDGQRAWLVTRPAATGTLAFYRRLGWRELSGSGDLVLLTYGEI
jgi:ribosomal protein S18 acetylase RimI-like enzyme